MNYNTLRNKPTINYRELIGDSTVSEVGGITEEEFDDLLDTDLASYYTKAQIDELFARSFVYREKSGSIVTFDCPTSTTSGITKVVSDIVAAQSGTGDPSPTNVRPISGWSAVNVTRDANIMPIDMRWENYYLINSEGVKVNNTEYKCMYDYIEVEPSTTYYIQVNYLTTGELGISVPFYADDKSFISRVLVTLFTTSGIQGGAFTTPANCHYIKASIPMVSTNPYLQYGSAYTGTIYTTTLNDGQGNPMTCYGGTLTNENGVQRLGNSYGYAELSENWNWQKSSTYQGSFYVDLSATLGYKTYTPIMCSHAKTINNIADYVYGGCLCEGSLNFWLMSADASVQDWKDFIVAQRTNGTPIGIKFELATPQTIPQDNLPIASQSGTNNMWCDSGDITVTALDKIIQE